MTTGGLDPTPTDPGARVDVEAIRARAKAGPFVSGASERVFTVDVPDLCDALEHERRVSAAWRALADARLPVGEESWAPFADSLAAERKALADLRALGIDPEAP